jgi:hypothetical protein
LHLGHPACSLVSIPTESPRFIQIICCHDNVNENQHEKNHANYLLHHNSDCIISWWLCHVFGLNSASSTELDKEPTRSRPCNEEPSWLHAAIKPHHQLRTNLPSSAVLASRWTSLHLIVLQSRSCAVLCLSPSCGVHAAGPK